MRYSAALIAGLVLLAAGGRPAAQPVGPAAPPGVPAYRTPPDFFPIVTWDRQDAWTNFDPSAEATLRELADCQFNVVGFVRPKYLPVCEKLGLMAIVAPSDARAGKPWFRNWKTMSDEDIDRGIRSMVDQAASSKAVLGYTIMDEPGAAAFPKLARAVAAVNRFAPGKLAHINLYPSYATLGARDKSQIGTATYTEYLERYVAEVRPQFLCYDNYMVTFSDDLQNAAKAALYFTNLLEVRRVAHKHGLPFWNVVCCNRIRPGTTVPSPANLALQAYTTLAAGGRGLTWFKYQQAGYAYAPIDNSGHKTETWRYLQLVNRQVRTLGPVVNRLRSNGVFFTAPALDKSLPVLPGRVVTAVRATTSVGGHGATTPVVVGEFTDEAGIDYVMLVNLSLERSANVKFDTAKEYKARLVVSSEDGRLVPLDEERGHWLTAGQGVLIRLERTKSAPRKGLSPFPLWSITLWNISLRARCRFTTGMLAAIIGNPTGGSRNCYSFCSKSRNN